MSIIVMKKIGLFENIVHGEKVTIDNYVSLNGIIKKCPIPSDIQLGKLYFPTRSLCSFLNKIDKPSAAHTARDVVMVTRHAVARQPTRDREQLPSDRSDTAIYALGRLGEVYKQALIFFAISIRPFFFR